MILSFGASPTQVKDVLCLPVGHAGRFELARHLNRPEHTRRADSKDEQRAGLPSLEHLGGVGGAGNMRGVDTRDCTNRSAANRAEGYKFDLCEGRPSLTDGDKGRRELAEGRPDEAAGGAAQDRLGEYLSNHNVPWLTKRTAERDFGAAKSY